MAKGKKPIPIADRFWSKVEKTDGCWLWTGSTHPFGYGQLSTSHGERPARAHRLAYELAHGNIPSGMHVLHACDNPRCVRPDHLMLGTPKDNMRGASARGRMLRGESHKNSKLTDIEVRRMRLLYLSGEYTQSQLSDQFGIDPANVSYIVRNKTWRHLTA